MRQARTTNNQIHPHILHRPRRTTYRTFFISWVFYLPAFFIFWRLLSFGGARRHTTRHALEGSAPSTCHKQPHLELNKWNGMMTAKLSLEAAQGCFCPGPAPKVYQGVRFTKETKTPDAVKPCFKYHGHRRESCGETERPRHPKLSSLLWNTRAAGAR